MPARFHPHAHRFPLGMQLTIELLRFFRVLQPPFTKLSCLLINKRYLLETRVDNRILYSASSAPSSRAFWLVGTAKVYSGTGADIVMESSVR